MGSPRDEGRPVPDAPPGELQNRLLESRSPYVSPSRYCCALDYFHLYRI